MGEAMYWMLGLLLLLVLSSVLTIHYYIRQNLNRFKNAGIPCTTPIAVLGNTIGMLLRKKGLYKIASELYDMAPQAKYVGYFDLAAPAIMVRDLDLLKSVAIKNSDHFPNRTATVEDDTEPLLSRNISNLKGDRWKHVRNLLTPAFTSSKIKSMFNLMVDCAEEFTDSLAATSADGSVMDMKDVFTRYTNDVIATCAFGISINSMKNRDNEFFTIGQKSIFFQGWAIFRLMMIKIFPNLSKFLGVRLLDKNIETFFKNIVQTSMKVRDEEGIYRPDLIQLLMETRGKLGEGKELTIEDMTAQAFTFFLGGFDTTSTGMCFAAHTIASHPEIYEKLQGEVDQVMEETKGKPTYAAINKMEYLDAVLNETLRLYPLAPIVDRKCVKAFELPPTLPEQKPFVIEEGMTVWVPLMSLHYDPKYFENPTLFNPDRFLDKEKNLVNHPAYLPFGLGPRMCIGNRFALLEIKILLCYLLSRCHLKVCSKTVLPMKFSKTNLVLSADGGFWLNISKREHNLRS